MTFVDKVLQGMRTGVTHPDVVRAMQQLAGEAPCDVEVRPGETEAQARRRTLDEAEARARAALDDPSVIEADYRVRGPDEV